MKIALLTHHFPPRFRAGGEQYAYRLAHGLHQRGCTVEVVTIESITEGQPTPICHTDMKDGFPVHRLSYSLQGVPDPFVWSYRNPALGSWVKTYLERFQPDLVHINSGYLLGGTVPEAAFDLGLPTILTLHDYWFVCPRITLLQQNGRVCHEPVPVSACVWCLLSDKRRYRIPDQWMNGRLSDAFVQLNQSNWMPQLGQTATLHEQVEDRRTYLKEVFTRFDLVITPSRFLMAKIAEYGMTAQRLVHVPIGLEAHHWQPVISQPDVPQKLRLGYLGQIAPHKGVHLLVEAFQKLRKQPGSCQLMIHGDMSSLDAYQRKLQAQITHDPDIVYAGPYRNRDVMQVLSQVDAVVVPSVWYENYPIVILEAMAQRKPVVATDLGGMAELVTHNKDGLLFPVGDAAALTAQLQRLLDEPGLLEQLRGGIDPVPQVKDELATLIGYYRDLVGEPVRR